MNVRQDASAPDCGYDTGGTQWSPRGIHVRCAQSELRVRLIDRHARFAQHGRSAQPARLARLGHPPEAWVELNRGSMLLKESGQVGWAVLCIPDRNC